MTLPDFEMLEEQGPGGRGDPRITSNILHCPDCRNFEGTYDRESAGMEVTCLKCKHTYQIPAFSDDPAVVLGQMEKSFVSRAEDRSFSGDSDYHGESLAIVLDEGWGLAGCLTIIASVVVIIGAWNLPGLEESTRETVKTWAWNVVVAIILIAIVRSLWAKWRTRRLGKLRVEVGGKNRSLAMGEVAKGGVNIKLNENLERCSLGVSLSLMHIHNRLPKTEHQQVTYGTLCRNAVFVLRDVNIKKGAEQLMRFEVPTPRHEPVQIEKPRFLNEKASFLKAKAQPWEEVRQGGGVHWVLTVELMGPRGVVFQQQKTFKVA